MGVYAAGTWTYQRGLREGFAGRITDYQLFDAPVQATASAARNPLGGEYHFDMQRPFLTDLQRFAWRAQEGEADDYVRFVDPDGATHALRLDRSYADIGGLTRIGEPGDLVLIGMSVSHEGTVSAAAPILVTNNGVAPDTSIELRSRYASESVSRINALLGYRHIRFVRATGLDAMQATQDIPVGFQIGTLIGQSASFLGSADHDMLVAGDMYAGIASERAALRLQVIGEAQRQLDSASWNGILASGRLGYDQRLGSMQTLIASMEWSGGTRVQVPFRLTLGALDEGEFAGSDRGACSAATSGVARRIEDRIDLRESVRPHHQHWHVGICGCRASMGRWHPLWGDNSQWSTP